MVTKQKNLKSLSARGGNLTPICAHSKVEQLVPKFELADLGKALEHLGSQTGHKAKEPAPRFAH